MRSCVALLALSCGLSFGCARRVETMPAEPRADPEAAGDEVASPHLEALAGFDEVLEAEMERLGVPGLGLAVVVDGEVLITNGYGVRRLDSREPVDAHTLFAGGSTAKGFTSLLTMMAVEEADLDVHGSPRACLPYFHLGDAQADEDVTVFHLLTHTAGVPRTEKGWYTGELSRREAIEMLGEASSFAQPGKRYSYQNVGYAAVGECAAKRLGGVYEDLVRDRVFRPLGMEESTMRWSVAGASENVATGHVAREDGTLEPATMHPYEAVAPAGGLWSSASDMGAWLRFHLDPEHRKQIGIVGEEAYAQLLGRHAERPKWGHYGFGWFVAELRGEFYVAHSGKINRSTAMVAMWPELGFGVAVLTNAPEHGVAAFAVNELFARLVEGQSRGPRPKEKGATATQSAQINWPSLPDLEPLEDLNWPMVSKRMRRARGRAFDDVDRVFERRVTQSIYGVQMIEEHWRERPSRIEISVQLQAFGRTIGRERVVFDGADGVWTKAYDPDYRSSSFMARRIELEGIFDVYDDTQFESVSLRGATTLDGRSAMVVVKRTRGGGRVVDFVDHKSWHVVRREVAFPMDAKGRLGLEVFEYGDFRRVDGVVVPHRIVQVGSDGPIVTSEVQSVTFDQEPPEGAFSLDP